MNAALSTEPPAPRALTPCHRPDGPSGHQLRGDHSGTATILRLGDSLMENFRTPLSRPVNRAMAVLTCGAFLTLLFGRATTPSRWPRSFWVRMRDPGHRRPPLG